MSYEILSRRVTIECGDPRLGGAISGIYASMTRTQEAPADVDLHVERHGGLWSVRQGDGCAEIAGPSEDDALFAVDKALTIELQTHRSDLLFLHAAALEFEGRAILLAADSGGGKSTTAWTLLHHGFLFMSDELAPIDLESMRVEPYPRALCLKRDPGSPYPLPGERFAIGPRTHIAAAALPADVVREPLELAAVFVLVHEPGRVTTNCQRIGSAEAAARLYVTALNALAHRNRGIDAVVHVARRVACFSLVTGDLIGVAEPVVAAIRSVDEC